MEDTPELRESAYGWLTIASQVMGMSKATASRDFALVRRIHSQFARMFGRPFNAKTDQLFFSWDWSSYGFRAPESVRAGHRKGVGKFPFSLRESASEESFCDLSPLSFVKSKPTGSELISLLKLAYRAQRLSQRLRT
jgi:hypothetical protein